MGNPKLDINVNNLINVTIAHLHCKKTLMNYQNWPLLNLEKQEYLPHNCSDKGLKGTVGKFNIAIAIRFRFTIFGVLTKDKNKNYDIRIIRIRIYKNWQRIK